MTAGAPSHKLRASLWIFAEDFGGGGWNLFCTSNSLNWGQVMAADPRAAVGTELRGHSGHERWSGGLTGFLG
jgi:hypothetical protein